MPDELEHYITALASMHDYAVEQASKFVTDDSRDYAHYRQLAIDTAELLARVRLHDYRDHFPGDHPEYKAEEHAALRAELIEGSFPPTPSPKVGDTVIDNGVKKKVVAAITTETVSPPPRTRSQPKANATQRL